MHKIFKNLEGMCRGFEILTDRLRDLVVHESLGFFAARCALSQEIEGCIEDLANHKTYDCSYGYRFMVIFVWLRGHVSRIQTIQIRFYGYFPGFMVIP